MKLAHQDQLALKVFPAQWELMAHLAPKAQQALQAHQGLRAWQGPLDLQDLRAAPDLQESEANRVIQEFQVLKEKLDPKGNQDHTAFKVQ